MNGMSRRSFVGTLGALAAGAMAPGRAWGRQDKVILEAGPHKYEWLAGWLKLPAGVSLSSTHGCVAVDAQDRVYLFTRANPPVQVFDADGNFVRSWGQDLFKSAHHIKIDSEGNVWLADIGLHIVRKCSPDGKLLLTLGTPGVEGCDEKRLNMPTDMAITPAGDVFVADSRIAPTTDADRRRFCRRVIWASWSGDADPPAARTWAPSAPRRLAVGMFTV